MLICRKSCNYLKEYSKGEILWLKKFIIGVAVGIFLYCELNSLL